MRNEIRAFSELRMCLNFSPVCCLNVDSPGHILDCLSCADSWHCVESVPSPSAPGCFWLCDITRAVGEFLLPSHFLLQKLSTPCSFNFIRGPPNHPLQHKWLLRPLSPGHLAERTCTAALCHFQHKQQSQDSDRVKSSVYRHRCTLC